MLLSSLPKERLQKSSYLFGMSCVCPAVQCAGGHVTQLYVREFYQSGVLNTRTVTQPQGGVLPAGGRPCSENPVWSPVQ